MSETNCTTCGTANDVGAETCRTCGTQLAQPEVEFLIAPEPGAPSSPRSSKLPIFIGAFVILALIAGGGLFFLLRTSEEDRASEAAVTFVESFAKVANGDSSACATLADVIYTKAKGADIQKDCEGDDSVSGGKVTIVSIDATRVKLKDGTGTVTLEVTSRTGGKTQTKSRPVTVRKVDGDWKVDLDRLATADPQVAESQ